MQTLRFLILTSFVFIGLLRECRCQQLVKDSTGNYSEKVPSFWGGFHLKPIDSTSCEFYHLKWQDVYRRFKDTLTCQTTNEAFLNIGAYAYQSYISQKNFVNDIGGHGNFNIQASVEYYFIKNLAIGIGFSNMRFKNSGYTPISPPANDTDKIVYRCTTIPVFIKFCIPADNAISLHASVAFLPTFVGFEKIRYITPDSTILQIFTSTDHYYTKYGLQQVIYMYECSAGVTFSGSKGLVRFFMDYALTWADLPYYYHYNVVQHTSMPQRFSAQGIKIGLSFDLGKTLDKNYQTQIKKFRRSYILQNPRPPDCKSI